MCALSVIRCCETVTALVWVCCVVCGNRGSVLLSRALFRIVPRSNCVCAWSLVVLGGARGCRDVRCVAVVAGLI